MFFRAVPAIVLILAGCGQSDEAALQNAAAQSDPAAAAILNGAAENGMDPQQALEQAGQAAAANGAAAAPPSGSVQARPNLPGSPNRQDGTQPPDRMVVGQNKTGIAGNPDPKPTPQ
ncbi:MAG TPA: hypothetical protein VM265_01345 [Sphingomicrobium sp.]|nr:hypothetical protein [Sphingomicrobium sp.]